MLQRDHSHPGEIGPDELNRVIGGAVIDDESLKIAKRLCTERGETILKKMPPVIIDNDHVDRSLHTIPLRGRCVHNVVLALPGIERPISDDGAGQDEYKRVRNDFWQPSRVQFRNPSGYRHVV